jgi:hypothetical protein
MGTLGPTIGVATKKEAGEGQIQMSVQARRTRRRPRPSLQLTAPQAAEPADNAAGDKVVNPPVT